MKKLLLSLLLVTVSNFCGVQIDTTILATVSNEHTYHWENIPIRNLHQGKSKIMSWCDTRWRIDQFLDWHKEQWEWCQCLVSSIGWSYKKDYYAFILESKNDPFGAEMIMVTPDQWFMCPTCTGGGYEEGWEPADKLYNKFFEAQAKEQPIYVHCGPVEKYENTGIPKNLNTRQIYHVVHVKPEDNIPKEFFTLTIDDAHTFLVGKDHYWLHNWAGPVFEAVVEWGTNFGAKQVVTAEQGAMPGWMPSLIHGKAGGIPYSVNFEEFIKIRNEERARAAKAVAKDFAQFSYGSPRNGSGDPEWWNKNYPGWNKKYENRKDESIRKSIRSFDELIEEHIKKVDDYIKGEKWLDYIKNNKVPEEAMESVKNGRIGHLCDEIITFSKDRAELIAEATRRGIDIR